MKIGDLVTWTSREDLTEYPTPWRRLGIILCRNAALVASHPDEVEVYWYGSQNRRWMCIGGLELAR